MIRYGQTSQVQVSQAAANNSLPEMIDRAKRALDAAKDSADILEALAFNQVAYDAAKSAGRLARAKQSHDTILAEIYRAQAEILMTEARAKMRLAEEYDAAQDRGEVAAVGQPSIVPDGNNKPATSAELGISRKDIHEARQIRDAEKADPGIVERAIQQRVEAGQEPTKAALREAVKEAAQIGLKGAPAPSNKNPIYRSMIRAGLMQRISHDFLMTPVGEAARATYQADYDVVRSLWNRELISDDQFNNIHKAIVRPMHAAALRFYRSKTKLIQRRRIARLVDTAISHRVRF